VNGGQGGGVIFLFLAKVAAKDNFPSSLKI
jgi:hypothetical protein